MTKERALLKRYVKLDTGLRDGKYGGKTEEYLEETRQWWEDVHALLAASEGDDLKARLADLHRPTHGPCCTCQACGKPYDECRCDIDDLADELAALRAALKQGREG